MICAWCEQSFSSTDRPVRLSTSQPPVRVRTVIGALGEGFAAVVKAYSDVREVTLYFHPDCWQNLADLLPGYGCNG